MALGLMWWKRPLPCCSAVILSAAAVACVPCSSAAASPGELDPSFGSGGIASFRLSLRGTPEDGDPATLAFGPGGAIDVAGTASSSAGGERRAFGARLLESGALDPSYGSGGSVVTSVPPSDEGVGLDPYQLVQAGVLEGDGAMVLVGRRTQGRLTSSGQFDSSFQAGNSPLNSYALVQSPDRDMLAAGETPTEGSGARYATLERVLPNGEPDLSFGPEGLVQLPVRSGPQVRDRALGMVVLAGGETLSRRGGTRLRRRHQRRKVRLAGESEPERFTRPGVRPRRRRLHPDGCAAL